MTTIAVSLIAFFLQGTSSRGKIATRSEWEYGDRMDLVLIIVVVVVVVVALVLLSGTSKGDLVDTELKAAGRDPDRQFRRPPSEGDLL